MSPEVASWWLLLRGIAICNGIAWTLAVARLPSDDPRLRRKLAILAGIYVLGCGWRSFFPLFDIPRQSIVDSWLSSVLVGRTVATVAEMSIAAQWALHLHDAATGTKHALACGTAALIVPLIALAQCCCWYSVLTTTNIGHVIEECIWGVCGLLISFGFWLVYPRALKYQGMILAWEILGLIYAIFMFAIDVPMYYNRWVADEAAGRQYLSLREGLKDVATRWVVSHRWEDWKGETVWMTLYFSVAVWLSIALVHAPLTLRLRKAQPTRVSPRRKTQ